MLEFYVKSAPPSSSSSACQLQIQTTDLYHTCKLQVCQLQTQTTDLYPAAQLPDSLSIPSNREPHIASHIYPAAQPKCSLSLPPYPTIYTHQLRPSGPRVSCLIVGTRRSKIIDDVALWLLVMFVSMFRKLLFVPQVARVPRLIQKRVSK